MIVKEQMRLSGVRKQTISEYDHIFTRMLKNMNIKYVDEISLETLFGFISKVNKKIAKVLPLQHVVYFAL